MTKPSTNTPFLGTQVGQGGRNAGQVQIDVNRLIRSRLLITSMSGGGKSWAVRRLLEQTHAHVQHLVLDPEGEFYSLRERYPYLLAAANGEVPAEPRSAKLLARKALETQVSLIADLSEMDLTAQRGFVRAFLSGLMRSPRRLWRPLLVVLDEAHKFAPERGSSESLHAVVELMSAGRKRGFAGVLATQRLSKLHKDAAAEAGSALIGLSKIDIDVRRAADLLGFATKRDAQRVRQLHPDGGEFFAMGPAWNGGSTLERSTVRIGKVETTHPKGGEAAPPTPPTPAAIAAIAESLADLPQVAQAEAEDLESARKRIQELERDLAAATDRVVVRDPLLDPTVKAELAAMYDRGLARGRAAVAPAMLAQLRSYSETLEHISREIRARASEVEETAGSHPPPAVGESGSDVVGASLASQAGSRAARPTRGDGSPSERGGSQGAGPRRQSSEAAVQPPMSPAGTRGLIANPEGRARLDGPSRKVLDAVAWLRDGVRARGPWPRKQVAFVAGYSAGSGQFKNTLGKLRSAGLIDYPEAGTVDLTREGGRCAEAPQTTASSAEVQGRALEICDGPMRRILDVLIESWPDRMSREDIAHVAGYEPTSGQFKNTLGKLRTAGLIEYPQQGTAKAAGLLFPVEERR